MNLKALGLMVFCASMSIGFNGIAVAVEPTPSELVERGSSQLPPDPVESQCADWPYCQIGTPTVN